MINAIGIAGIPKLNSSLNLLDQREHLRLTNCEHEH